MVSPEFRAEQFEIKGAFSFLKTNQSSLSLITENILRRSQKRWGWT